MPRCARGRVVLLLGGVSSVLRCSASRPVPVMVTTKVKLVGGGVRATMSGATTLLRGRPARLREGGLPRRTHVPEGFAVREQQVFKLDVEIGHPVVV